MRERTSSDRFFPKDSPAHLLEVVEIESQPLITLLGQVGQLPVGDKNTQSNILLPGNSVTQV